MVTCKKLHVFICTLGIRRVELRNQVFRALLMLLFCSGVDEQLLWKVQLVRNALQCL